MTEFLGNSLSLAPIPRLHASEILLPQAAAFSCCLAVCLLGFCWAVEGSPFTSFLKAKADFFPALKVVFFQ